MESECECYLRRAAEARWLADVSNPILKRDFLRIAESWEMVARAVSERDNRDPRNGVHSI
jgi:hypothetical protein